VRSRKAKARTILRERLIRQGITADDSALAAVILRVSLSPTLSELTTLAATGFAAKNATSIGAVSAAAAKLATGALHAMTISKVKILGATAIAFCVTLAGVETMGRQEGNGDTAHQAGKETKKSEHAATADRAENARLRELVARLEQSNRELQDEVRVLRKMLRVEPSKVIPAQASDGSIPTQASDGSIPAHASDASSVAKHAVNAAGAALQKRLEPMKSMIAASPSPKPASANSERIPGAPGVTQFETAGMIVVVSPRGDNVVSFNKLTGARRSMRLADADGPKLTVKPVAGAWDAQGRGVVALEIRGPSVKRLAVASELFYNRNSTGTWYSHDLSEPVESAIPRVGSHTAVYVLGRYVYALAADAGKWDVLELPQGVQPKPTLRIDSWAVPFGPHLYIFNNGKWVDVNTDSNVDEDGDPSKANAVQDPALRKS
jgi:hypothetical protein